MPKTLSHVLWMGGSPCSGKSTISKILVQKYGWQLYACDDHFNRHIEQASSEKQPCLHWIKGKTWDEIFLRPLDEQVEKEIECYREEFSMFLDDLRAMPTDQPILAEGTGLIPEMVAPLLNGTGKAIWVVPSERFQRRCYPGRGEFVQWILKQCQQPKQCFKNWMDRDVAFAHWVEAETRRLDLPLLQVTLDTPLGLILSKIDKFFKHP